MHSAIKAARDTLARLQGCEDEFEADARLRESRFEPLLRHVPKASRASPTQGTEGTPQMTSTWDDWHAWARGIAVEVCGELADEAGEAVGKLEAELRQLRVELNQLRADIAVERSARNGEVIDLPANFWRKRNDNAA